MTQYQCQACNLPEYGTPIHQQVNIMAINSSEEAKNYGFRVLSTYPYNYDENGLVEITWSITSDLFEEGLTGISGKTVYNVIRECLEIWGRYCPFHFVEQPDSGPRIDGSHSRHYGQHPAMRIGKHPDGKGGSLAHSFMAYAQWSNLEFGDIHFDSDETWDVNKFKSVCLHEMGHALGLDHNTRRGTLMYALYIYAILLPTEGDVVAMRTLYPTVIDVSNQYIEGATVSDDTNGTHISKWAFTKLLLNPYMSAPGKFPVTVKVTGMNNWDTQHDHLYCLNTLTNSIIPVSIQSSNTYIWEHTNYQSLYEGYKIWYRSTQKSPGITHKYINYTVSDSTGQSNRIIVRVTCVGINDPITITANTDDIVYDRTLRILEPLFPSATINNESNDGTINGGYVFATIKNAALGDELYVDSTNLSVHTDGISVTINFGKSENLESIIRAIQFRNIVEQPLDTTRTVELYIMHENVKSNVVSKKIWIKTTDIPPKISLPPVIEYIENIPVCPAEEIELIDEDTLDYSGVIIECILIKDEPEELIELDQTQKITIIERTKNYIKLRMTEGATSMDCAESMKRLRYNYESDNPKSKETLLKWIVSDGRTNQGASIEQTIRVNPVNDPFTISVSNMGIYQTPNSKTRLVYRMDDTSLMDIDNTGWKNGSLQVYTAEWGNEKDNYGIISSGINDITVHIDPVYGKIIKASNNIIAHVTTEGNTLRIEFTEYTTSSHVASIINIIYYQSSSIYGEISQRIVRLTLDDGEGCVKNTDIRLHIYTSFSNIAPNQPPTITNIDTRQTYRENMRIMPNVLITDPNSSEFAGGKITVKVRNPDKYDSISIRPLDGNIMIKTENESRKTINLVDSDKPVGIIYKMDTYWDKYNIDPHEMTIHLNGFDCTPSVASAIMRMITYDRFASFGADKTIVVNLVDGDMRYNNGDDDTSVEINIVK